MRQKFMFVTAIAVCFTLALVPAFASERTVDRNGDRTKAGRGVSATGVAPARTGPDATCTRRSMESV